MIKTVFFDVDNTLICFKKSGFIAVKTTFEKNGIDFKEEYMPVFFHTNESLWHLVEKGDLSREEMYKIRFTKVIEALGIKTTADTYKMEKDFRDALFNIAEPVDGAKELLEYLSKKYRLCIASNSIYEQQENRLKIAGLYQYFDKIFVSEKVGYSKPQKEFFDGCFNQLNGEKPEETAMIGDSLTADMKGAKEYGINAIWYNHMGVNSPDIKVYDYKVNSLLEIKKIL